MSGTRIILRLGSSGRWLDDCEGEVVLRTLEESVVVVLNGNFGRIVKLFGFRVRIRLRSVRGDTASDLSHNSLP